MPVPDKFARPSACSPAIPYGIFLLVAILTGCLHLATILITALFAFLVLQTLSARRYRWIAVAVFLVLLSLFFYGFGLFVRQDTPPAIIATLNAAAVAALDDPAIKQKFVDLGATARPSTPEAFAAFLKTEDAGIGELAKKGLLKPE